MKLNLFPPCLIFVRKDLGSRDGSPIFGMTSGPIMWLREDAVGDKCIFAHEAEHIRQAWRGLILFHILLLRIPRYRAWCEARAYRVQEEVQKTE